MSIRPDTTTDVLNLIDGLRKQVEKGRGIGNCAFLNRDNFVFQLEKIKASVPREMKDAANVTRESERIISAAEEEASEGLEKARRQAEEIVAAANEKANLILEQARLQQMEMISDSTVLRLANSQAEETRSCAEKESRELRRGADKYAHDVLSNLEDVVGRVLTTVEKGRRELEAANEVPVKAVVEQQERVEVRG